MVLCHFWMQIFMKNTKQFVFNKINHLVKEQKNEILIKNIAVIDSFKWPNENQLFKVFI